MNRQRYLHFLLTLCSGGGIDPFTGQPSPSVGLTATDMTRIQLDYHSYWAVDVAGILQATAANTGVAMTASGVALVQMLAANNGSMAVGNSLATLATAVYQRLVPLTQPETNTSVWRDMVYLHDALLSDNTTDGTDPACVRQGYPSCAAFTAAAVDAVAAQYLPGGATAASGNSAGRWGLDNHAVTYAHEVLGQVSPHATLCVMFMVRQGVAFVVLCLQSPLACLADRSVPHGGDDSTVNVGHADLTAGTTTYGQSAGPSYRQVVDFSSLDATSLFVHGPGQSGNTLDNWYGDLARPWSNGQYLSMSTVTYGSDGGVQTLAPA
jgi:acyl-homoserine lactone acylase PvdQ